MHAPISSSESVLSANLRLQQYSRMVITAPLCRPLRQRGYSAHAYLPWQCLYFLPEPQGQSSLRPTLPQLAGFLGSRSAAGGGHQRGVGERHLVLAGIGIELVRFHRRQCRLLIFRRHDFDAHQLRRHRLAQMRDHRLEQAEGFRLVFLQRIALAVAAQADHLTQMIEHHQMLAPQMIQRLQQDGLLDVTHHVGAPLRHLGRHVLVDALLDARQQFLVGDALFLGPFIDRQIDVEHALQLFLQARRRPTARHRHVRARAW